MPPDSDPLRSDSSRLDDAARAGWLYFIAGNTQDEIARTLHVSRATAQRLVSLALSERLITFRLDHPIAACMDLEVRLKERFGLSFCQVVPTDAQSTSVTVGVAEAAAGLIEARLRGADSVVIALGTGRMMRAAVSQVPTMDRPDHQVVSLVGNISPDGSATFFDAVTVLADRIKARHFPMPLPLFLGSQDERDTLLAMAPVKRVHALAAASTLRVVGIGQMDERAQLFVDGFVTPDDLAQMERHGVVGEIAGWAYDAQGHVIDAAFNMRVTSVPLGPAASYPVIGAAMGQAKVPAIAGALRGKLINGLVTNETTAKALILF